MASSGVLLRLRLPTGAFWGEPDCSLPQDTPILDVTFVDDECVMLAASSPKLLDVAIAMLLEK
eukprot:3724224-Karenia_brevis.AAC.1